ncbi:MAG TPA: MraZ N-terminal domain-containing protein, partial [Humidesulfovibrio sp.]
MRLLGHAHRSLDPKGRLMLTPEFRDQFLAETPDGRLVLTIYQGQIIGITPEQWDTFVAELEKP